MLYNFCFLARTRNQPFRKLSSAGASSPSQPDITAFSPSPSSHRRHHVHHRSPDRSLRTHRPASAAGSYAATKPPRRQHARDCEFRPPIHLLDSAASRCAAGIAPPIKAEALEMCCFHVSARFADLLNHSLLAHFALPQSLPFPRAPPARFPWLSASPPSSSSASPSLSSLPSSRLPRLRGSLARRIAGRRLARSCTLAVS